MGIEVGQGIAALVMAQKVAQVELAAAAVVEAEEMAGLAVGMVAVVLSAVAVVAVVVAELGLVLELGLAQPERPEPGWQIRFVEPFRQLRS